MYERRKNTLPSFTKKAIMETFLHLTEKKPLEKITIRDLVDECGINRNTFYYYFQDIYAVLEEYCDLSINSLAQENSPQALLCGLLRLSADFSKAHPRAAKMLAFSLGHEGLDRYLGSRLQPVLRECILKNTQNAPSTTLLHFLRHAVIGLCLDTMRAEKGSSDFEEELTQLLQTFFG